MLDRARDVQRVLENTDRCLNPDCRKPLKYSSGNKAYCCRACEGAYTPLMIYFERLYAKPFRDVLVTLLHKHRNQIAVAKDLEVEPKTVSSWCKKFNIRKVNGKWV